MRPLVLRCPNTASMGVLVSSRKEQDRACWENLNLKQDGLGRLGVGPSLPELNGVSRP